MRTELNEDLTFTWRNPWKMGKNLLCTNNFNGLMVIYNRNSNNI